MKLYHSITRYTLFLLITLVHMNCATTYVPTSLNVPIFSNKGEFQAKLLSGTNGGDIQLAFAPTKHLGLMINASASGDSEEFIQFRRNTLEIGAGYYVRKSGRFVIEAMAGLGVGDLQGVFSHTSGAYFSDNVSTSKIFVQPALGLTSDLFDVSLATRISIIGMEPDNAPELIDNVAFLEPVLTIGVGFRWLKLQGQVGFSAPFNEKISYTYTPLILNLGFGARIGKKRF